MKIKLLAEVESGLGEGPTYIQESDEVLWTDITGMRWLKHNFASDQTTVYKSMGMIGAIAVIEKSGFIAAVEEGFAILGEYENYFITNQILDKSERMNDGKCDARGRFWAGSTNREFRKSKGKLFRLDADFTCKLMLENLTLPNGLDWSPSNEYFYLIDSLEYKIWRFDFEINSGDLGKKELFYEFNPKDGIPDGLCISATGHILIALYDGSAIHVISPDGSLERIIHLPVTRPTSCTFVGPNLDVLAFTSASIKNQSGKENEFGQTFLISDLGFVGKKPYTFGGELKKI